MFFYLENNVIKWYNCLIIVKKLKKVDKIVLGKTSIAIPAILKVERVF